MLPRRRQAPSPSGICIIYASWTTRASSMDFTIRCARRKPQRGDLMKQMTTLAAAVLAFVVSWSRAEAAEAKPGAAWEGVVAAAKKEGEVRLWGDMEITHPDIV